MALVAYDNSDSSEFEDDDETASSSVVILTNNVPVSAPGASVSKPKNVTESEGQSLFNLLPQPSTKKPAVIEEDDEFLHKRDNVVKLKAKITVPSLSDFRDVEERPIAKPKAANGILKLCGTRGKRKREEIQIVDVNQEEVLAGAGEWLLKGLMDDTSKRVSSSKKKGNEPTTQQKRKHQITYLAHQKRSGLLSMLPQPRNALTTTSSKSLIPHVLTRKPAATNVKKKEPSSSPIEPKTDKTLVTNYSDESDTEEVQNDFFSFNKKEELTIDDVPLDIDKPVKTITVQKPRDLQSFFKQDLVEDQVESEPDSMEDYSNAVPSYSTSEVQDSSSNNAVLDEEAILKLCGTRGKRKREEIQIVDVNQEEVLAGAGEWLLKGLMDDTSKRVSSSKKKGNEPTTQQKRKHQITYLAHQAKANEAELQNQWANNRMSKRQTQSKYGF